MTGPIGYVYFLHARAGKQKGGITKSANFLASVTEQILVAPTESGKCQESLMRKVMGFG